MEEKDAERGVCMQNKCCLPACWPDDLESNSAATKDDLSKNKTDRAWLGMSRDTRRGKLVNELVLMRRTNCTVLLSYVAR